MCLLAALVLGLTAQDGEFALTPKPKYEDWTYRMHRLVLHIPKLKTEFAMRARQKVISIDKDGKFAVLFETRRSVVFQKGETKDTPFSKNRTLLYDPSGWQQPSFLPGETGTTDISLLVAFRAPVDPVRIGKSWSYSQIGEPGMTVKFTLLGPERLGASDCLKVESDSRLIGTERPAQAKGYFWIHQDSGMIVMSSHKITNLYFAGRQIEAMLVYEPTDPALFERDG